MRASLRFLLAALGVSAITICLAVMITGPTATVAVFEHAFDFVTGGKGAESPAWPAVMDNELRFYAPLFGGFGLLALLAARDFSRYGSFTPWLAAVFFAGGVGRSISLFAVGSPHPFFLALMAIELILPLILVGLWAGLRSRSGRA